MPSSLPEIRHSLAHLLAAAIKDLYGEKAKFAIGPAIDNGFYYDIDFGSAKVSDDDLPKIEEKMRNILPSWETFTCKEVSEEEARQFFSDNPYKLELIDELATKGERITLYTSGTFTDLCRGGHVENAFEIDPRSFRLTHLAGAYWRGNEKNPMLTRIYGAAFPTATELDAYLTQREEAKRRDHRKLGRELDLFTISDLVGPGLPLFTPRGSFLRETLASFSQELQARSRFERVWTPHMARTELYKYSGHFDKYPERFEVTSAESDDAFMLKPMNCPHHAQLFARKAWSYRELPVRYMENTTNYRDEKSGELHGLSRVRSLSQDDGHVFCQEIHVEAEVRNIVKMVKELYSALGMRFYARLSFRDDSDKFLGSAETWEKAEGILRAVAKEENLETVEERGEAAFYGPKIDYIVLDSLGREWQCATIQVDFIQPERFGLSYIDTNGEKKQPVMIHKALLGSIERFLSVYIEHTAGAFPLWLSPVQVAVLPVSEKYNEYAESVLQSLRESGLRAELDASDESLGKKIRNAKTQKIPYILVLGEKEASSGSVTLESRDQGSLGAMALADAIARLQGENAARKAS